MIILDLLIIVLWVYCLWCLQPHRGVCLDGCGAGRLAYQDTRTAKHTLVRRTANNEGGLYVFFEKGPIHQAPYVVVTEWYRHGICQDGIRKSLHSHQMFFFGNVSVTYASHMQHLCDAYVLMFYFSALLGQGGKSKNAVFSKMSTN